MGPQANGVSSSAELGLFFFFFRAMDTHERALSRGTYTIGFKILNGCVENVLQRDWKED